MRAGGLASKPTGLREPVDSEVDEEVRMEDCPIAANSVRQGDRPDAVGAIPPRAPDAAGRRSKSARVPCDSSRSSICAMLGWLSPRRAPVPKLMRGRIIEVASASARYYVFPGCHAACCRYADGMCGRAVAVVLSLAMLGCEDSSPTTPSGSTVATVRLVFMGATARRTNLPASAQACVNGVGATHTHPSWHSFASIPLQAVPPDRYEITFTDVPVNTRVSLRVNESERLRRESDRRSDSECIRQRHRANPEHDHSGQRGRAGFAFTVAPDGTVSQ